MSETASLKDYWCPKKKIDRTQRRALIRLLKDLRVVKNNPLPTIVVEPLENDLFNWHGNIKGPSQSPFEGGVFHFAMSFPSDYPVNPPTLKFFSPMPHPFVLRGNEICLRLTEPFSGAGKHYKGWSPIYDVYSILLQLQSFFIDGLEATTNANTGHNISFSQKQTSQWKVVFENRDQQGEGTLNPSEIRELLLEVGERKPSEEELALYYHMQHIPKDQPIDFCTFLDILRRKREYRKVVETFNRFSCCKCTHVPQKPYPPFNNVTPEDFIIKDPIEKLYEAETECYFSKTSIQEPDCATLGVGICVQHNPRNGQIHKVFSSRTLVSLNAFRKHKATNFPDSNLKFTHWFPLYLNEEHGKRAMHLLPRALGILCTGSHRDFNPDMVVTVIPKLMGDFIQQIIKGQPSDAVNALTVYAHLHHLLMVTIQRYPDVRTLMRKALLTFINDPHSRNKELVPNLNDFLTMMFVIGTPEEEKKEENPIDILKFYQAVIDEINVRSVLWILKKNPELVKDSADEKLDVDRIENSFESSKAGFQILLIHRFFYADVSRPGVSDNDKIAEYNARFGRPTQAQIDYIIKEFNRIGSLPHYNEVYQRLGLSIPEKDQLLACLYDAIKVSTKYNYHCKRVITVQSADEYLKEKLKSYITLDSLVDEAASKTLSEKLGRKAFILKNDENVFKDLCIQRFGANELPPVDPMLSEIPHPWQHFYLKLNMEDMLTKFNENPDFKRFYRVLELSAYSLRSVEFTVVPVTNIKSNFYYLTALLTNMWNLEKFTVKKGEIFLDLKGCKALCKGLKNNPDSIRMLDLHYCHITEARVKILEDGLLSSKGLLSLNIEGNPIGDTGASSIAKVIRAHSEITHLNVSSCDIRRAGAVVLAEAFYHNKSLKVVQISKNFIDAQGLAILFKQLAYSRTIERIECIRNGGSTNSSVAQDLTRLFEVSTSLQYINFYKTPVNGFMIESTLHGLGQNRSLTELDLGESCLGENNVTALGHALAKNRNIRILHLENANLGQNGIQCLAEAIYDTDIAINERNRAKLLRDLTPHEISEDLRPRGCNLERVNLNHNYSVISNRAQTLALERFIALTTTIVELDLSHCGLGVPAGDALGKGLVNHPSLLRLNLKGNSLDEYGVKKLCKGLHENSVLRELDISRNGIRGRGASGVAQLLANPKSGIEVLNLHGNFIGIEGARFIATALESNSTLTDLDLGLNRMRPKGVFAITQSLKKNVTLKTLRLKQNFINDKTAMELGEVLITQPSITRLCLAGNKVKDAILNSIVSSLKTCPVPVSVDVATLLEVTQLARLQCTVYCTPLPQDITSNSLKKMFYDGGCGAIVNVSILRHAKKDSYATACYAFVEFAESDSVQLALDIGSEGKAKIGKYNFSVIQAQGHTIGTKQAAWTRG